MPINVLRGPPGGGKSQFLKENAEGDIHLDTTTIVVALLGLTRDEDGVYCERLDDEKGLKVGQYMKWAGLRFAAKENIDSWFTIANSAPEAVEKVRAVVEENGGKFGRVHTIDPGIDEVMGRLAFKLRDYGVEAVDDLDDGLSEECRKAVAKWYGSRAAIDAAAARLKLAGSWSRPGGAPSSSRPIRRGR